MTTTATMRVSAAPAAGKYQSFIFMRSISTAHWTLARPVTRIPTPYSMVSSGKVMLNHSERKIQNAAPASTHSPLVRSCPLAASSGALLK